MKKIFILAAAAAVASIAGLGLAMDTPQTSGSERNQAVQRATEERAAISVPAYQTQNFLRREAINKLMERQDTPSKIWYVYEVAEGTGAMLGYYTASTPPQPYCGALTPTDRVEDRMDGDLVRGAPSLDGIYGGGDCATYYFFDAVTDTIIMTQMRLRILDAPLAGIDAPHLTIEVVE